MQQWRLLVALKRFEDSVQTDHVDAFFSDGEVKPLYS